MIFAMMEKSTFDKNGIKRHAFLTLISFHYLQYTDRSIRDERSWGQFLTDDLDIFSTTNKANTLSVAVYITSMVFSYFLTSKSRIRSVYSKTKKKAQETQSYFQYTCKYCHFTKLTIMQLVLTFCRLTSKHYNAHSRCSKAVFTFACPYYYYSVFIKDSIK